jgi:hypothetical protein
VRVMTVDHDQPADPMAGLAARRERMWGLVGGGLGAIFGVGSALIAVYVEKSPWFTAGPYPEFFTSRRLLAYDQFLLAELVVGFAFTIAGGLAARFGRYPRTDGFAASLVGAILSALAGTLLFTRLVAVVRAG